jgi:hypothetical protein
VPERHKTTKKGEINMSNENITEDEKDKLIELSMAFFDDVLPQIGDICIQDYTALSEMSTLFAKFKSKQNT